MTRVSVCFYYYYYYYSVICHDVFFCNEMELFFYYSRNLIVFQRNINYTINEEINTKKDIFYIIDLRHSLLHYLSNKIYLIVYLFYNFQT